MEIEELLWTLDDDDKGNSTPYYYNLNQGQHEHGESLSCETVALNYMREGITILDDFTDN